MVTAKQRAARARFVARFAHKGGSKRSMPKGKSRGSRAAAAIHRGARKIHETVGVDNVGAGLAVASAANCPSTDGQSLYQVWKNGGGLAGVRQRFHDAWLVKGAAWSQNPYWAPSHASAIAAPVIKIGGVAVKAIFPRLARVGFRLGHYRVRLAKG